MKNALGNIMQQAQKMQEDFQKAQEELAAMEVQGESGGGLVKILMTGKREVRKIEIDDSLVGDDKDMLEDLVAAAVNDAVYCSSPSCKWHTPAHTGSPSRITTSIPEVNP